MGGTTKIEWTDATFNPWLGCTNVSPGCDHCYSEALNARYKWVEWGPHGKRRRTSAANWKKPLEWQRNAAAFLEKHGHRQRVFCASLADVFDNQAAAEWRADLWQLIRDTPDLDWQLLTKRPQNIRKMLPADWGDGYPNIWLGTTTEDQEHYDQRWSVLRSIPARIRFISYEPALGPLRLGDGPKPDWIISGGESGPGARVMNPAWVRSLRDECQGGGVALFHKQHGTYRSNPLVLEQGLSPRQAEALDRHGKGGGLLDGRLHRDFPLMPPKTQKRPTGAETAPSHDHRPTSKNSPYLGF